MVMFSKLGGMAPVCEGVGSYFALEQSLVIFLCGPVHWSHCVTNLDRIVVCWLCHCHWKHCIYQHFQIWPQQVSGNVIPLYGGVSKSSSTPCILSARSMTAVI